MMFFELRRQDLKNTPYASVRGPQCFSFCMRHLHNKKTPHTYVYGVFFVELRRQDLKATPWASPRGPRYTSFCMRHLRHNKKRHLRRCLFCWIAETGFEPATSGLWARRATGLLYSASILTSTDNISWIYDFVNILGENCVRFLYAVFIHGFQTFFALLPIGHPLC